MSTLLMNEMCQRGHEVHLFTWDLGNPEPYYKLDSRVSWKCLNYTDVNVKVNFSKRIKRLYVMRKILKSFDVDVVVAFQHGAFLNTAIALSGLNIPIIAAERESPDRLNFLKSGRFRFFYFQSFRLASVITVQVKRYTNGYPIYLRERIVDIPNPVVPVIEWANTATKGKKTRN